MFFRQLFDPESSTYTYLIADDATHEAVIIDPVIEQVERDLKLIREHGLRLKYALETHVHADHITAAQALKKSTGAVTAVCKDCNAQGYDQLLQDGDVMLFGHEEITVIATPGHTPCSVSYLWRDRLFSGDTLLIGGCGRTDLPSGDSHSLFHSLQRLLTLSDDTAVFPAHDYDGRRATTIGRERKQNPRLKLAQPEFADSMRKMNLPTPPNLGEVLATNQRCLE